MNRIITLLIIWIITIPLPIACAQENTNADVDFESRLILMKNPFKSQLPRDESEDKLIDSATDFNLGILESDEDFLDEDITGADIKSTGEPEDTELIVEPEIIIPLPEITITGIIWNSDRPQAIINEQIVNIGDTILEIKITEIGKAGINGLFDEKAVIINTKGASYEQQNYPDTLTDITDPVSISN